MQATSKRRVCSVFLVLLGAAIYAGTAVAETYEYELSGDLSVWDISGTYSNDAVNGLDVTYNLAQDAKGKLSGGGNANGIVNGYPVDVDYTVIGSVTQSAGVTHVKMTIKFKGTIEYEGKTYRFRATVSMKMDIDPVWGMMFGTIRVSVSAAGATLRVPTEDYVLPITDGTMDGSADLTIDVTQDGKKVTGTGTLELSNTDKYEFTIKGTFSVKKNLDTLKLTSPDKQKLTLKIDMTGHTINSLKGKVLGQSLKAEGVEAE